MDTSDGYELTWHEDDELHQAEGMLAVRLGISVDEAAHTIHRRAEASALTTAQIATRVLDEAARPWLGSARRTSTIPGVDAGSISITHHGRIETRHPSTEAIGKLDRAQSELDEGPCITVIDDPPAEGSSSRRTSPPRTRRPLTRPRPLGVPRARGARRPRPIVSPPVDIARAVGGQWGSQRST